ncbi:MAG: tetratricopeptide repeat protein [Treponema sp.]|nr:tetratricopeptide repeat protein [Treponema sp.]
MKLDAILTKATRFARKGKYDEAIKTLEIQVNRYYGSYTYYYLLGLSYLYSDIFGRALEYLRLASKQNMRDPYALLGLAALYLNHGDTDKAVNLYLEVQSIDASNRIAKKALKIIQKNPAPEEISAWIDSGRLHTLFPPFPKADIRYTKTALGLFAVAAGLVLALGISLRAGFLFWPADGDLRELPPGFELSSEERALPLQAGAGYRFTLTAAQVLEQYEEARRLFLEYRDDAARIRLNRILESNASEPIKNRARLLISYMEVPGFDTLRDRFSFSQVLEDPLLFRDSHVIWRGMPTNLSIQHNATSFDLLVGYYDDRRVLEGIVQVSYDFAIPINPEFPVEILGRVIPVHGERGMRIQGVAINQAGLLDRFR